MKLEVGKKYVSRNEPRVKYTRVDAIRPEAELQDSQVAATQFYIDGAIYTREYTITGRYQCGTTEHPDDLVAEYVEKPFVVDKLGVYKQRDGQEIVVVRVCDTHVKVWIGGAEGVLGSRHLNGRTILEQEMKFDLVEYVRPFTQEDFV